MSVYSGSYAFCEMSSDCTTLLRGLRDPLQLRAVERIIQFPLVLLLQMSAQRTLVVP